MMRGAQKPSLRSKFIMRMQAKKNCSFPPTKMEETSKCHTMHLAKIAGSGENGIEPIKFQRISQENG